MEKQDLEELIKKSLNKLLSEDLYLLEHDVNERTITHKLAMYITELAYKIKDFSWDIDVEYNRNYDEPKRIGLYYEDVSNTDTEANSVFPDIIIHSRGKNNTNNKGYNNLLVIEIKKDAERKIPEKEKDIRKIKAFLTKKPYNYMYGLFINFKTGVNPDFNFEWVL